MYTNARWCATATATDTTHSKWRVSFVAGVLLRANLSVCDVYSNFSRSAMENQIADVASAQVGITKLGKQRRRTARQDPTAAAATAMHVKGECVFGI